MSRSSAAGAWWFIALACALAAALFVTAGHTHGAMDGDVGAGLAAPGPDGSEDHELQELEHDDHAGVEHGEEAPRPTSFPAVDGVSSSEHDAVPRPQDQAPSGVVEDTVTRTPVAERTVLQT